MYSIILYPTGAGSSAGTAAGAGTLVALGLGIFFNGTLFFSSSAGDGTIAYANATPGNDGISLIAAFTTGTLTSPSCGTNAAGFLISLTGNYGTEMTFLPIK